MGNAEKNVVSSGGGRKMTSKPRGMAVAKVRAREDASAGVPIHHCPYSARAWQTVWLREMERAQQIDFLEVPNG